MSGQPMILHTYDVAITHVFRINAPGPEFAHEMVKSFMSVSGRGLDCMMPPTSAHEEVLFGSTVPKGPRNPNRMDISENGHKRPDAEPEGPKIVTE